MLLCGCQSSENGKASQKNEVPSQKSNEVTPALNLVDLHTNAATVAKKGNQECLKCHTSIEKEVSLDEKFKTFHRLHLESKKNTPKNCADCHESIDLREGSAAALRKQVSPDICATCHSSGAEQKVLFAE
jgi:hypothetical protein